MGPRIRRASVAFCLVAALFGCVTLAPRNRRPGTEAVALAGVPVLEFGPDRCGPASLAAVLSNLGEPVHVEKLEAEIPKAPGGGVLSIDLLLAARARGYEAELVRGDEATLSRSVLEGRAAIVMLQVLNAPGRSNDLYHYVVVDGVDTDRALFRFQFGDGRTRWAPFGRRLKSAWRATGFATLLVRPSPRLSPLRHAVALERSGQQLEALAVYRRIADAHPDSARTWTNLGNVLADVGRPTESEEAYRHALAVDPEHPDALNNLAWVLLSSDRTRLAEAESLVRRALAVAGSHRGPALDTLGRILLVRGRCRGAAMAFQEAIDTPSGQGRPSRADLDQGLAAAREECVEDGRIP